MSTLKLDALEAAPAMAGHFETDCAVTDFRKVGPDKSEGNSPALWHAVVLAASRTGENNPLALAAGVSHKCLINLEGKTLIEHVLCGLLASPKIGRISISHDAPALLEALPAIAALLKTGKIRLVPSDVSLFSSLKACVPDAADYPCLITTADNVLLTGAMVDYFCARSETSKANASLAMTSRELLLSHYPDGQRRFHRFRDGAWSNCNLYAIKTLNAFSGAQMFKDGGQFAKSPARVLKAFGLLNALAYRFRWFSRPYAMKRLGQRFGVTVEAIDMPFPEAPIDVDNERTQKIAHQILRDRQNPLL